MKLQGVRLGAERSVVCMSARSANGQRPAILRSGIQLVVKMGRLLAVARPCTGTPRQEPCGLDLAYLTMRANVLRCHE